MENKRKQEGVSTGSRRLRKCFFNFYVLLATRFPLRRRLI